MEQKLSTNHSSKSDHYRIDLLQSPKPIRTCNVNIADERITIQRIVFILEKANVLDVVNLVTQKTNVGTRTKEKEKETKTKEKVRKDRRKMKSMKQKVKKMKKLLP